MRGFDVVLQVRFAEEILSAQCVRTYERSSIGVRSNVLSELRGTIERFVAAIVYAAVKFEEVGGMSRRCSGGCGGKWCCNTAGDTIRFVYIARRFQVEVRGIGA